MIFIYILLILFLSFVLIKSTDLTIVAIRRLGREGKASVFALSAIILAIGTSFPELFVSVTSALEGSPNLSLGVVLGSNIANISLIAGVAAVFAGRIHVSKDFLKRDISVAMVAGLLPVILVLDGNLNRVDGLILLAIYFAYTTSFFKGRFLEIGKKLQDETYVYRFLTKPVSINAEKTKEVGRLFVGIALMLFVSDSIVKIAIALAASLGLSIFLVGLILLAIGTSLPELAFSIRSLRDEEPKMFFGNLLGSTIANSTLIVGVAAVIHPIEIMVRNGYLVASISFVVVFLSFWYFIKTKYTLERWEATILLLIYIIFVFLEIARA